MFTGVYWTVAKWITLVLGTAFAVWFIVSSIYDTGYNNGRHAERVQWQEKEGREATLRQEKIKKLESALAKVEDDNRRKVATIELNHTKEMEKVHVQKERDVTAALTGVNKLRWHAEQGSGNGRSTAVKPEPDSRVCDDTTGGELPPKTTANLYSIVNDADRNTKQLGTCQDLLLEYDTAIDRLRKRFLNNSDNEVKEYEEITEGVIYPETTNVE